MVLLNPPDEVRTMSKTYMDPSTSLETIRQISDGFGDGDFESDALKAAKGEQLAVLVQTLDEWIAKGGFLPRQWQGKGPAHAYPPVK